MSPRADEHEGDLNDSSIKRAGDKVNARALEIMRSDVLDLTESGAFLRFFSRFAYPALTQAFPVNNGSLLAHFMGKRELILDIVKEMDALSPGFLSRMLAARFDYERELTRAAGAPEPHKEQ